jgi:hypothetical protein
MIIDKNTYMQERREREQEIGALTFWLLQGPLLGMSFQTASTFQFLCPQHQFNHLKGKRNKN